MAIVRIPDENRTLREVVETLAPIDRTPCSPGEREAADWLAERMRKIDGVDVTLEDESSWGCSLPTFSGSRCSERSRSRQVGASVCSGAAWATTRAQVKP